MLTDKNSGETGGLVLHDERTLAPHAIAPNRECRGMTLEELLPSLVSPDSHQGLRLSVQGDCLVDASGNSYPLRDQLPLLLPSRLQPYFTDRLTIQPGAVTDPYAQYFFLSAIKQSGVVGAINAPADDVHYQRHLFRMKEFLRSAYGKVLDVGCDDPVIGSGLLPGAARYVGLDPFCGRLSPFRVIGFGEYLPFSNASFDCVIFNTSLDHILDWRRAIDEARRVLVPGGRLYISTLIWTDRADLVTDAVHFHHFRDYEIFGALQDWVPVDERRYDYKGASHRHGLYVSVQKPGQERA